METKQKQSERVSSKLVQFKNEIISLHEKEKVLDGIDSKIIVSNVLAEISFLINEKIVLKSVELVSEKIQSQQNEIQNLQSGSVVRAAGGKYGNSRSSKYGNVRFKVIISGVAAGGGDVAALLCSLEDSPYFDHIDLSYSRDAQVKRGTINSNYLNQDIDSDMIENKQSKDVSKENIKVSEFEISCYLANYQ